MKAHAYREHATGGKSQHGRGNREITGLENLSVPERLPA